MSASLASSIGSRLPSLDTAWRVVNAGVCAVIVANAVANVGTAAIVSRSFWQQTALDFAIHALQAYSPKHWLLNAALPLANLGRVVQIASCGPTAATPADVIEIDTMLHITSLTVGLMRISKMISGTQAKT